LRSHRGAGCGPDQEAILYAGQLPLRVDVLHYSSRFVHVIDAAHRLRRNILSDHAALEAAWRVASPHEPLAIKFVGSPLFEYERLTGRRVGPIVRPTIRIGEDNFADWRPLLADVRELILEGDGSGRGRLGRTGFQAEPADLAND
jgi:hypothetical protein